MARGIVLSNDFDILRKNGTFVNGEAELSEAGVLLSLSQGNLKNAPLIGPGLVKLMRGVNGAGKAVAASKLHLAMDGKSYEDLKEKIRFNSGQ